LTRSGSAVRGMKRNFRSATGRQPIPNELPDRIFALN
jgi:hypothetical protein